MKRGLFLIALATALIWTIFRMEEKPKVVHAEEVSSAAPVMTPYLNRPISEVLTIQSQTNSAKNEEPIEIISSEDEPKSEPNYEEPVTELGETYEDTETEPETEYQAEPEQPEQTPVEDPEVMQESPEEVEPNLIYLGTYLCTAYCGCPECCGDYCGTCTASGTVPEEGRTVACNSLPLGSVILVDGCEYVIEDTGYTPYGDAWLDFYFESHDAALAFGLQEREVWLIG